jgi:hypothetical protein
MEGEEAHSVLKYWSYATLIAHMVCDMFMTTE